MEKRIIGVRMKDKIRKEKFKKMVGVKDAVKRLKSLNIGRQIMS